MEKRYSIFEAKAKFSELVRAVLSYGQVVITQRGTPVIRLIPYAPEDKGIGQHLDSLVSIGKVKRAKKPWPKKLSDLDLETNVRDGAVSRFLKERE